MTRTEEIKERLSKATPGEWRLKYGINVESSNGESVANNGRGGNNPAFIEQGKRNMVFIAHSKSDITFLLSEIARLQEALESIKGFAEGLYDYDESEFSKEIIRISEAALQEKL